MKSITDSFLSLGRWSFVGSFGWNTDILATNLINISVVLGILIFFGKGVLSDLLDNRKNRILNTIQNSEELRGRSIEKLEKARSLLRKVEREAEQFRLNRYSEIERENLNLLNSTYKTLEQFENDKNETILFEQQRAIHQVQQQVFQQALQRALETLTSCLNTELHLRTISTNIRMLGTIKKITD
uniref:ATP synthase CF0 B subunit n=1 Tax=Cuscuta pedicellata TaxID=192827 RepID=A0A7H0DH05_9ASTE|nr:ATP synthase CF0 B subunit [Cuscuta pedicellata]QNP08615.1 ATP synthase CF0 B subunit [Cuscuta pedicellata]